jgi:hypothetical protein
MISYTRWGVWLGNILTRVLRSMELTTSPASGKYPLHHLRDAQSLRMGVRGGALNELLTQLADNPAPPFRGALNRQGY